VSRKPGARTSTWSMEVLGQPRAGALPALVDPVRGGRAGQVDGVVPGRRERVVERRGRERVGGGRRRREPAVVGGGERPAERIDAVDVALQPVPVGRPRAGVGRQALDGDVDERLDAVGAVRRAQVVGGAAAQRRLGEVEQGRLGVHGAHDRVGVDALAVREDRGAGAAARGVDAHDLRVAAHASAQAL